MVKNMVARPPVDQAVKVRLVASMKHLGLNSHHHPKSHQQDPEEVGVALDSLTGIPHQAIAFDQVPGIAEGYEGIIPKGSVVAHAPHEENEGERAEAECDQRIEAR
jgi:hypothetical protein